jgi:hypothetical protein
VTRAAEPSANGSPEWAKAPDFAHDPAQRAAVRRATVHDREHYLSAEMTEVECRGCGGCVLVKKYSSFHTTVQWNPEARKQCRVLDQACRDGRSTASVPTCPHLPASIDYRLAEGLIPSESPETDPDGYW